MIQFTSIEMTRRGTWIFKWADAGAPFYRVVLFGRLVAEVEGLEFEYGKDDFGDDPPLLEVVKDDELALSEINPPFLIMQWWPQDDTAYYDIERKTQGFGSAWVPFREVTERQFPVYTQQTKLHPSEEIAEYRIHAVNIVNVPSDTQEDFKQMIVTPDDFRRSDREVSYDKGTTSIVISAPV